MTDATQEPFQPIEGKCNARKTDSSGLCAHEAGWQTSHPGYGRCKWHGGATPNQVKNAERQMAQVAAVTYGAPREVDPAVWLLEEVARTAGIVDWLAGRIRELAPDALVQGVREIRSKIGPAIDGAERAELERVTTVAQVPSVWLDLYLRERKHLVAVCRDTLAAGVQERQVRIAEETGMLLVSVLRGVLDELGLSDRPDVGEIVGRHLRLVGG